MDSFQTIFQFCLKEIGVKWADEQQSRKLTIQKQCQFIILLQDEIENLDPTVQMKY